jgi:hypothetical protein
MPKTESEIRAAVENCLEQCYKAESTVLCLAELSERMRAEGWERADVRRVEGLVMKVLAALSSPSDDVDEETESEPG